MFCWFRAISSKFVVLAKLFELSQRQLRRGSVVVFPAIDGSKANAKLLGQSPLGIAEFLTSLFNLGGE